MSLYLVMSLINMRTSVNPEATLWIDFSWETIDEATTDPNSIVSGTGTIGVDLATVGSVSSLEIRNAVRDAARLASAAAGQTIVPADRELLHSTVADVT